MSSRNQEIVFHVRVVRSCEREICPGVCLGSVSCSCSCCCVPGRSLNSMCLVSVSDCHALYVIALHGVVPRLAVCLHASFRPAISRREELLQKYTFLFLNMAVTLLQNSVSSCMAPPPPAHSIIPCAMDTRLLVQHHCTSGDSDRSRDRLSTRAPVLPRVWNS